MIHKCRGRNRRDQRFSSHDVKPITSIRAGSVCLNSFGRFAKWISASIMLPP
ncbi:hypothetical protein GOD83_32360, partial [Sinorhizobium medicae]|nr:hypothetical protein [Sinorhizobium medicae]MDX0581150.1 hypothetical protein [Sinorhizobium medicae]MDX0784771.1 hypothetical protein [Sinorhizobium medicae]